MRLDKPANGSAAMPSVPGLDPESFERLKEFIEQNLGIKIPPSKKVMLESRLSKRLRALGLSSFEEYCAFTFGPEGYHREIQLLIDAVTTNETDFFREDAHYRILAERVLPDLISSGGIEDLRLWSVAASTGQEAYTLAMVTEEYRNASRARFDYTILGTDVSDAVLRVASTGVYTERQAEKIPGTLKRRYCLRSKDPDAGTIRMKAAIRERIMFRNLNLMNADYGIRRKYHVVFCRNVFIYFDRETQRRVLSRVHSCMAPGAYLFMGHSENLSGSDLPLEGVAPAVYRNIGGKR